MLLPVLRWVLAEVTDAATRLEWVDSGRLIGSKGVGPNTLATRIARTLQLSPCDLLFVHRDADQQDPADRTAEIAAAAAGAPHVAVVPVRTAEAWLLFDEAAIRAASGRASGREALDLPGLGRLEEVADPETMLFRALRIASGTTGRRARAFDENRARQRVAELVEDWTPLRRLPAFQKLEGDVRSAVSSFGAPVR